MTKPTPSSSRNAAQPSSASRGIAIIGMSGRYPGGANSPNLLWETLKAGTDAVNEAPEGRWDSGWHHPDPQRPGRVYTRAGGFLDSIETFDADFFGMSPREARQVDPQQRLLLELAWEAHEDAGIAPRSRGGSDTGVFVGISSNDYASLVGPGWPDAYSNTGSSFSIAANRISYLFDFHGPSVAVDTACSSSLVCVHQACMSLLAGECTTALAGGVSILTSIRPWLGFAKASMLSPTGRCKSFDASGDGYVRAEGGGLVLLKPLQDAERDGDPILGVILASGVNSDGRTMGLSMPNADAQERLLRTVYSDCGVEPEDVFYVEAHGTGTAVGDPIECSALGKVLGSPRKDGSRCLIGSVKSNIGHLEAASGIAGLTKALLTLKHREVPGNLHFNTPNPKIEFDNWKLEVVTTPTPLPDRERPVVVGVNSFGFGGTNSHLVIQEYRAPAGVTQSITKQKPPTENILLISGNTEAGLKAVAQSYAEMLQHTSAAEWPVVCAAAATCRTPLRNRLALSASTPQEAIEKLKNFLDGKPVSALSTGSSAAINTPVAFVYSGNGPQWWGMGRQLLAENPVFRADIEATDAIFAPLAGWSLIEEMHRPESDSRISLTEIAQPMLFAQQLALTEVLKVSGIHPAAVLGHSVGEAAAAFTAGALTREQATRLIYHRSKEQGKTAGSGRMAALGCSAAEAKAELSHIDGWLEIAAINSPQSVTVAGDPAALEKLVQSMTGQGKFARVLPLDYPFHTKAMDPIRAGLVEALRDLAPADSRIPFISTVEGLEKPGPELDAEYWYRNVREPVRFNDAVTHLMKDRAITVFLEIGPHPVLRDYMLQSAKAAEVTAVATAIQRRPGPRGPESETGNLATAICVCHANGVSDLGSLFTRPNPAPALPLYSWQRSRHWRGSVILPDTFNPIERDHPLLGHRLPSQAGLWENQMDTNRLSYLKDHVVQNAVLFPAAGYIEMALAAGRIILGEGTLDVEDFEVLQPLTLPNYGDPLVQTHVDVKDGTVEISSRADRDATDWVMHARGRLSRGDSGGEAANLADLSSLMPHAVSAKEHYQNASIRGLDYGPEFQGVSNVLMTAPGVLDRQALAEIVLPISETPGPAGYLSHPSLLDSCIQVLITLIAQNSAGTHSTIPVQLGRVRSIKPLTTRMFCHVFLRYESDRSAVADFRIMDADGNLLMTIDQARCQKVDFQQIAATPLTSEWWRPSPHGLPEAAPSLPSPLVIAAALETELQHSAEQNGRAAFYATIRKQFNRLAGAYAAQAIAGLNPGESAFDVTRLARKSGVKRGQLALLGSLIRMAAQDGQLVAANSSWRWNQEQPLPSPALLWRELMEAHPRYHAELLLFAEVGESLTVRLLGRDTPEASSSLLDQLHDTSPFQTYYNQVLSSAVQKLVDSWPAGRPIRILEIAGGAGSLASWVLPVLPSERADYVFTDPSEAQVGRAEYRLASHRFARFATLDLTRDFTEQDQPAGYFDVVLGAHFLTPGEVSELLERVTAVMAPGGLLLTIQTNEDRFAELVLGRTAAVWTDEMRAAGFIDPVPLDDWAVCTPGESTQQSVLLAHRPAASIISTIAEPEVTPRNWLLVFENKETSHSFDQDLIEGLINNREMVAAHWVPDTEEDLKSSIAAAIELHAADEVVFISGLSVVDHRILATQTRRSLLALSIVQALESGTREIPCRLTFVTRGAFPTANGQGPVDPGQAPVWGLGRVIGNEHSLLRVRMIDLHSSDATMLAAELRRQDAETEIQLSAGFRYVNRERLNTLPDEARQAGIKQAAYQLDFQPHGGLDSLYLRAVERQSAGPHQVEIAVEAAGINFRDVLWAMGMLPEEAVEKGFSGPTIGMECAGRIVSVGDNVTDVKPGDRVVAFASSCFATHVITDANAVAVIPDELDFAAAATIPTAFLTAYYAFDYLARLEAGETVLIHGAAGGVGMAAIQIAQMKGAKIIGTAGSPRKRRMLELLGVDHVLNSRSLEFADEVMKITGGVGVDVVLNSLAGEAITKSLKCLRPFGRFLEIGKRDLYANSKIGLRPFRNNLSYFGIDADTLIVERADLARAIFKKVVGHFATGALRPLPFQAIPISRAAEAFRTMQQSRHVGKLVITVDANKPSMLAVVRTGGSVKPGTTYLVTGGLGGFGLATAEWLADQGATSLALIGRRGAVTDEATSGISRLEKKGVQVRAFAADVSDSASLDQVLITIRAEMAPLAGIIHSAAVIEDAPVMNLGIEQLERVYRPKLLGAWNLHQATLNDSIDLFVLYSSSSAVVGNPGQGAYVAANLYLDALALYRRSLGLPALAIGWGAIKDAGFLTRHEAVAGMLKSRTGLDATPAQEALADLGRLISVGATRVSVGRFDLLRLSQMLPGARVPRFLPIIPKGAAASLQAEELLADVLKKTPEADRRALVVARVREHGARVLGTSASQINVDQPLAELGLDSLMAVELASGIERDLGRPVSVMQMLSAGSLAAIAELVIKILGVETEDLGSAPSASASTSNPASALQELKST